MAKRGRPSKYTKTIARKICKRLAAGESLRAICSSDDMPAEATVRDWAIDDLYGFSAQYTRAREIQAHTLADEIIDISNTPVLGIKKKTNEKGDVEIAEGDMIEHRRLQIDSRKWYTSKVLPKIYGDKLDLTSQGERLPTGFEQFKDEDLDKEIERLEKLKGQARLRPGGAGATKSL